jgi:hypothetical protein
VADFKFSVSEHSTYLAGYMDAVGRSLTSEDELVSLCSTFLTSSESVEKLVGSVVAERPISGRWSSEFGPLLKEHFGIEGKSRLGFYLIDYIDWFHQFTDDVECTMIRRQQRTSRTLFEALYLLRWSTGEKVVLSFTRDRKSSIK